MADEKVKAENAAASAEPINRAFDLNAVIERAKEKGYEIIKNIGINTYSESIYTNKKGLELVLMNLGLNKPLNRYIANKDTGVFEHVLIKYVSISAISLNRIVSMTEELRDNIEYYRKNPTMYHKILMHCEIDVIQQPVIAGVPTISLATGEEVDVDNTQFWYEPIAIRIADQTGYEMLKDLNRAIMLGEIKL